MVQADNQAPSCIGTMGYCVALMFNERSRGAEDVFEVVLKDGTHGIVIDVTVAWPWRLGGPADILPTPAQKWRMFARDMTTWLSEHSE